MCDNDMVFCVSIKALIVRISQMILGKSYFLLLILLAGKLTAQTNFVIIDSVHVLGLNKTKKSVVLQETDLHPGDTLALDELATRLNSNEKRLQSAGLFTLATINVRNWNTDLNTCNIEIKVQENWYIYPYIIFELADRNFNVWRKEFNYSFNRVNYGLALTHINFTGHKDKLKAKVQAGYLRKLELSYEYPYIWGNWGLSANVLYTESREVAYKSVNNKPVFYKNENDKKVFFQHKASATLHYRGSARYFQSLRLEFIQARIDSYVSEFLNPYYFDNSQSDFKYLLLDFVSKYDNTLYPLYPVGGYKVEFNLRKEGLGFLGDGDNSWFTLMGEKHTSIFSSLILSNRLKFKLQLQKNPISYFLNTGIGYSDNEITGYQLYVLDGKSFVLSKNTLKLKVLDDDIKTFKFMPKYYKVMNTKLFLRFNFDIGMSHDPVFGAENSLSNTWQYGYGPGIDLILFNNFMLSAEFGITRFGETGIFFDSGFNF